MRRAEVEWMEGVGRNLVVWRDSGKSGHKLVAKMAQCAAHGALRE